MQFSRMNIARLWQGSPIKSLGNGFNGTNAIGGASAFVIVGGR
jgi:hypothetical protein